MAAAAILAGGRARRMGGRDKSALAVGGAPIIDRVIAATRAAADDGVFLVANDAARFARLGLRVAHDQLDGGAMGGVFTALAESPTDWTLVVACDMPFLDARALRQMLALNDDVDAVIPRTADGLHPLCAAYARSCAPILRQSIDDGRFRLRDALARLRVREADLSEIAPFDRDGRLLMNVNTPDDYRRALELSEQASHASSERSGELDQG